MNRLLSSLVSTASSLVGSKKAGQPQPESYFASARKSSAPQPAHRYTPGSNTWSYSPLNGRSVPLSRRTWNCSGVRSRRHSASVFLTFAGTYVLSFDSSLQSRTQRLRYAVAHGG